MHVVNAVSAVAGGRFNFLLTDGTAIAATAAGDSLFWRSGTRGVVVASEPCDDGPDWQQVPDRSLLTATAGNVEVRPIPALTKEHAAP
jgi:glutamine amidotransferase